jgi:hypothetical protein
MRTYALILLGLIYSNVIAQNFRIDPFGGPELSTSIAFKDSTAYITGANITPNLQRSLSVIALNYYSGDIKKKEIVLADYDLFTVFSGGSLFINDTILVLGASHAINYNIPGRKQLLGIYNINSEQISLKLYGDTSANLFACGYNKNSKRQLVSCGSNDSLGSYDFQLSVYSSTYETIRTSIYPLSGTYEIPLSIDTTSDCGYLIAGVQELTNGSKKAIVMRIDSSGSLVWMKNNYSSERGTCGVTSKFNGYLIASVYVDSIVNSNKYVTPKLIRVNGVGSIISSWKIGASSTDQAITRIKELNNSVIVGCGTTNNNINSVDSYSGFIFKCDTTGNIKFYKQYRLLNDSTSHHYLNDIAVLPDGGYVATGFVIPSDGSSQDIWVLKVDSNGCEQMSCGSGIISLTKTEYNDSLFCDTSRREVQLTFSGTGGWLYYTVTIDNTITLNGYSGYPVTAYLAPGTHTYSAVGNGGVGYIQGTLNINCVTGIAMYDNPNLKIYPNPFTHGLHISAQEEISGITLFDLSGAKCMEVEKVTGTAVDISTDRLAKGIYLLEVRTRDGVIRRKVVKD